MKKTATFTTRIGLLTYLPGMHYLEVSKAIMQTFEKPFKTRFLCTVSGMGADAKKKISYQCGILALGQGRGYISITKKRMQEVGAKLDSKVNVKLVIDESKYGMKMPEELAELLKQDKVAKARFEKLTPGKQRTIMYYIAQVKNPDLRLERAFQYMENLKPIPVGKETFRAIFKKES